ncbi:MAG TPA: hypothetical protein VGJ86_09980 [Acidimicrobiales bacterium]|jgi:hypothetical protein
MRPDDGGAPAASTTSSAKPAKLLKYRDDSLAQVAQWEPEVTNLDTDLTSLRNALSGVDLPEDCQVSVLFWETWFDTVTRNQRHLDEWVGDVANEFIRINHLDPKHLSLDQVVSADNWQINVGFADREESERQAREDAALLDQILDETGMIHPYDLLNDPDKLEELARKYPQLRDILARAARFGNDEDYAAMLVNTLGPQNVRTLVDLTNTFGLARERGMMGGDDPWAGYVVPLAMILGNAERGGHMDPAVRNAILDMNPMDEPPLAGKNNDFIQEGAATAMRQRALALILAAGGGNYSPQMTADMADHILDSPVTTRSYGQYEGFTDPQFLQDHRQLASNDWAAYDAISKDDAAAHIFYNMDQDGDGHRENLIGAMNWAGDMRMFSSRPGGIELAADRLGVSPDSLRGEMQTVAAEGVRGGLLDYPLATKGFNDPTNIAIVSDAIEITGWDHMHLSDPMREAMARVSTPYTRDIAIAAENDPNRMPPGRLTGLSQDEVDKFLQQVSQGKAGRMVLSQNAAALVSDEIGLAAPDIAANHNDAMGTGERLAAGYYRELGEAWDKVQIDWVDQREALVNGWKTVTDPVLDLVSGKIVDRIPGGNLPLVKDAVDGISGEIKDGLNSAIYDHFIPKPELEAMTEWRDAVGKDVYDAVGHGLYDNPATRTRYLREAGMDPNAQISESAFEALPNVKNAVNHYGDEILTDLQARMGFDKVFK